MCGGGGGGRGGVREGRTERPGAILTRVRVPGASKGRFSQSPLSVQTLLRCSCSSRVQWHAATSVRALKHKSQTPAAVPYRDTRCLTTTTYGHRDVYHQRSVQPHKCVRSLRLYDQRDVCNHTHVRV